MINISQHSMHSGRYRLETYKGGILTKSTGWFHNLLTDVGLDAFVGGYSGQSSEMTHNCEVGTGTVAPTFADTALTNKIASVTAGASTSATYVAGSTPYYTITYTYTFGTGVAAGNLSEIGIRTIYGPLLSRALILDENANPTTITVLSDEILIVTYELRQYIDTSDTAYSFPINGVTYSGVYRWAQIGQPLNPGSYLGRPFSGNNFSMGVNEGAIGTISGTAGGASAGLAGYAPTEGYSAGSLYLDAAGTFGPTEGNFAGGISSMTFGTGHHRLQFSITPPIPKVTGQNLTLRMRFSWGRYP